jgi:hypothetical protein
MTIQEKSVEKNRKNPVWFFPGTFGHAVTRYCTVPANKSIPLPILNSESSYIEFLQFINEIELRLR